MKTKYKAAFWANRDRAELVKRLETLGILLNPDKFEVVEFFDDAVNFQLLKNLFDSNNIHLTKVSIYEKKEKLASSHLGLRPSWHYSYPQPEDTYEQLCYDLSYYCTECGIGRKQIKSLRLKGEPKWGNNNILQVNWIHEEFFVTTEMYQKLFHPIGIGFLEVINDTTNTPLTTVVQLDIPIVEYALRLEKYDFEICNTCYKKKYLPIATGGYPQLEKPTQFYMFKTREFFGSGARAYRNVYINNNLYLEFLHNSVKGVDYVPVLHNE